MPLPDALARIKAAFDARQHPDLLIVARTDADDPAEALKRAARDAEAGAGLIQPISRALDRYEQLIQLREACGRRLSLQLMAGAWMTGLSREQIESMAAFASYQNVKDLLGAGRKAGNWARASARPWCCTRGDRH